tara:strand:- start:132 stop:416 length:285 start_codon:yes stop_codon:yes gene_type:complete
LTTKTNISLWYSAKFDNQNGSQIAKIKNASPVRYTVMQGVGRAFRAEDFPEDLALVWEGVPGDIESIEYASMLELKDDVLESKPAHTIKKKIAE